VYFAARRQQNGAAMPRSDSLVFPEYSARERRADALVHIIGLACGSIAFVALILVAAAHGRGLLLLGLGIYGAGLMAMLLCSALYNLSRHLIRKELLRRADHAAIFVLIAATYTPFVLVRLGGDRGLAVFALVWVVAATGAVLKFRFPRRLEGLSVALYLLLGWVPILLLQPLFRSLETPAVVLLVLGGALYTLGVVFHLAIRLSYHNAIWHLLVLLGAGCHYAAVLRYVALPFQAA
jgi:hemolysin III